MTKFSIFCAMISVICANAWVERKMLSSFKAATLSTGATTSSRSTCQRQERYAPLIMTTDAEEVDLLAVVPPPKGRHRRQIALGKGKKASVLSRTVQIASDWKVTVYEWEKPAAVVETYWQVEQQGLALTPTLSQSGAPLLDPFGLVCWPGAVVAAQEMKVRFGVEHRRFIRLLTRAIALTSYISVPVVSGVSFPPCRKEGSVVGIRSGR